MNEKLLQKEMKSEKIHQFIKRKKLPVVTLRLNIPGNDKKPDWSGILFDEATRLLDERLNQLGFTYEILDGLLGFEYYEHLRIIAVKGPADTIKSHMIAIENDEVIGRLLDIDVLDIDLKGLSRSDYDLGHRKCFLCNEPAYVCTRTQRHSKEALMEFMILKAQALLDK
jgi:holo-ACP synthase CitX